MSDMAGRAKVFYSVHCEIHGVKAVKGDNWKYVKVGQPRGKQERLYGGCPACKRERGE